MANKGMENGFGMETEKIQKLVEREKKWQIKNQRNKIAAKLLKAKIAEAGIVVTEQEIDAAIAQQGE
ncbi:MAG: hypothetical protein Q7O12_05650 [Deltaproteobacteria bacterium]|nr:hypothetical protein [Deltaproteobacteria bacterium]